MSKKSELYKHVMPSSRSYISPGSSGSGVAGVGLNFAASRSYERAEIYIDRRPKEINEFIFDAFYREREQIEAEFGESLAWERLEARRACRIKSEVEGNVFDRDRWPEMIDHITGAMCRIEKCFKNRLAAIVAQLGADARLQSSGISSAAS